MHRAFNLPAFPTALALALAALPAGAESPDCPLESAEAGVVAEVPDGKTLVLAGGEKVRLVNALAANPPPVGNPADADFAEASRAWLEGAALGWSVRLAHGGREVDRHGQRLAHVFRADGKWLQGGLVERGLARVYSFADNRACVAELLVREALAREAGHGLWAREAAILPAEPPDRALAEVGRFAIVEGKVLSVGERRLRTYLNFGTYWNVDFTVIIAGRDRDRIAEAGMDLAGLAGQTVRVRGWILDDRGPAMAVTHPEQIEIVGEY